MSLSKSIILTIKDFSVTLSSKLNFYKGDTLKLVFTINQYGVINAKGELDSKTIMPLDFMTADLLIETPEGVDSIEAMNVEDNTVTFLITDTYTQNVGVTRMQIVLKDEDGCKSTLPDFEMEIRNTLATN